MSTPTPTGPRSENPYCMRCSKHLGMPFHETNEHDEAADRTGVLRRWWRLVKDRRPLCPLVVAALLAVIFALTAYGINPLA